MEPATLFISIGSFRDDQLRPPSVCAARATHRHQRTNNTHHVKQRGKARFAPNNHAFVYAIRHNKSQFPKLLPFLKWVGTMHLHLWLSRHLETLEHINSIVPPDASSNNRVVVLPDLHLLTVEPASQIVVTIQLVHRDKIHLQIRSELDMRDVDGLRLQIANPKNWEIIGAVAKPSHPGSGIHLEVFEAPLVNNDITAAVTACERIIMAKKSH